MATKKILKFKTKDDYKIAKKNHLVRPNVSSIEESGDIHINGRFVSKEKAEAGTIIAYHEHTNGEKEIKYIVPEAFDKNDNYWTADAVVVVPYSHTGDGTVRAMALNYASCNTPSTGDTGNPIVWGDEIDIAGVSKYSGVIKFANYDDKASSVGTSNPVYLPSDAFSGVKVNPYDTETIYTANNYAPSPYNEDGTKNDAYHSLGAFASVTNNSLKDMDGKGNTLKILRMLDKDFLSETLYASTIRNEPMIELQISEYETNLLSMFPAACACARYSSVLKPCTIDTSKTLEENIAANAMPWYLPACGEVGYSIVRGARIQYAMSQVGATTYNTDWMWASSEYDSSHAWLLLPSSGSVDGTFYSKNGQVLVRPFTAF